MPTLTRQRRRVALPTGRTPSRHDSARIRALVLAAHQRLSTLSQA